ncbi:NAD(P)-dependent oxidoreductase [Candidatus Woesearchaeota archaeon]|nr:NAD(P)-dependent oxidoreductase [Candidatus Woesearchaeota archaeon]
MKILITGATGFVGKNLLKAIDKDYDVRILSRKKLDRKNVYIGDLFDKNVLLEATKVDIVIHLAGITKGDVMKVNSIGTKNLIEACIVNNVEKFIFISSYNSILKTRYGESKKSAEDYVRDSGLKYIIFRPTVIYGPENNKDIDMLAKMIKKYSIAIIPGNGEVKLQPLFVNDLVNAILKVIKSDIKNRTYFIAGEMLSFNQIVDKICKTFSKKAIEIHIPEFIVKILDKNLLQDKICKIEEIKKDFDFNPTAFEKGINYLRHDC